MATRKPREDSRPMTWVDRLACSPANHEGLVTSPYRVGATRASRRMVGMESVALWNLPSIDSARAYSESRHLAPLHCDRLQPTAARLGPNANHANAITSANLLMCSIPMLSLLMPHGSCPRSSSQQSAVSSQHSPAPRTPVRPKLPFSSTGATAHWPPPPPAPASCKL